MNTVAVRIVHSLVAAVLVSSTSMTAAQIPAVFEPRVSTHRLANGWTFLIVERHQAPVVSFVTIAKVGSAAEQRGATGLAHMFEHMAFKGTPRLGSRGFETESQALEQIDRTLALLRAEQGKPDGGDPERVRELARQFQAAQEEAERHVLPGAFANLVSREGGVGLNAFTNTDVTGYVVSLPANKIELWAYLESERFLDPVFRQFYKEVEIVKQEQDMRRAAATNRLFEAFVSVGLASQLYEHPVLGHRRDVEALTVADAQAFHRRHYVPENMVTAIVGDVVPADILPLLDRYFSRIPGRPAPSPVTAMDTVQEQERRTTVTGQGESVYLEGYRIPSAAHPDFVALRGLSLLLGAGRTSRLQMALVRERRLASRVSAIAGYPGTRYPSLLAILVVPVEGRSPDDVEGALRALLARVETDEISSAELTRIAALAQVEMARTLARNVDLARELAVGQALTGDWRHAFRSLERLTALTAADIQRVARTYLRANNRTVAVLRGAAAIPGKPR